MSIDSSGKITTTGGGVFAGDVRGASQIFATNNTQYALLDSRGYVNIRKDSSTETKALTIYKGGSAEVNEQIVLHNNGSAKFTGLTEHGGGVKVTGGSTSNVKPGGLFYNNTADYIVLSARNYDNDNNPATDNDNSVPILRGSLKRDYNGNRFGVGGNLDIESLVGNVTINSGNNLLLRPSGNVGIGTTDPQATLDVAGTANFSDLTEHGGGVKVTGGSATTVKPGGLFYNNTADYIVLSARNYDNDNNPATDNDNSVPILRGSLKRDYNGNRFGVGGNLDIESLDGNVTIKSGINLILNPSGYGDVGIGTTDPGYSLDVVSTDTGVVGYAQRLRSDADARPVALQFTNNSANKQYGFIQATDDQDISIIPGTNINTTFKSGGYVGIGTETPSYTLDVSGYIRTTTGIVFPDGSTQTTAQTGGGGTPANMVTTDTTQSITGQKTFSTIAFNGSDKLTSQGDGFQIRRNSGSGFCGANNSGTGGMAVKFQDGGNNVKIGVRNSEPEAAIDCCAAIKANQYNNRSFKAAFDGQLFTSEDGIDFNDETRFHDDVIQEGNLYSRIPTQPLATTASISTSERAVAVAIRAAFHGFVNNGVRQFSIDKQSLVNAFTDNGLDIADYGIMSEITQSAHEGFEDDDTGVCVEGVTAETYSVVNYRALFAFVLAAGPDLSALEARLTALENA